MRLDEEQLQVDGSAGTGARPQQVWCSKIGFIFSPLIACISQGLNSNWRQHAI